MTARLGSLALAAAILFGCTDPSPPSPVSAASSSSSVSAAPAASSAAKPAVPPPPDHWSTTQRDPATEKVFAEARPGTEMLVAVSVVSDDGDEGEVWLEHAGADVRGKWGDTVVTGSLNGVALELKDAGTQSVVFRGKAELGHGGNGGKLEGTLRAEGEERSVRSLPPLELATLTAKLSPVTAGQGLEIVIDGGKLKSVAAKFYGARQGPPPKPKAELEADAIAVTDERGTFRLHATAHGFLGRPPGAGLLVAPIVPSDAGKPLPLEHEGVKLASKHFRKGAPRSSCDIDLEQVAVAGTPHDVELNKKLDQASIDAAAGFWPSGEPPPTLASFGCKLDAMSDTIIQSSSFVATPLPGGHVDLVWSGYSRTSSMTPPATTERCMVLDGKKGELIDVVASLPDEAKAAIVAHADKAFARSSRSRDLTRDDFFVVDRFSSLEGASVCATTGGVRLLVPTGVITKSLPGPPFRFDIPKSKVAPKLPPTHFLHAIWGG